MTFRHSFSVLVVALGVCGASIQPTRDAIARPIEPHAGRASADGWPGWRGLTAQGRSDRPLPIRWTAIAGIRWKTPIPGRGHSSPIVFGDRVYVTTAYTATNGVVLQGALRLTTIGLLLAVAALTLRLVDGRVPLDAPRVADVIGAATLVTLALLLAIVGGVGGTLFDLSRSNMRAWMASTVFASLCLALAAAATDRRGLRMAIAASSVLFAAFTLAAFPSPSYAFRGGVSSLRMQIAMAASALPLLVGVGAALSGIARRVPIGIRRLAAAAIVLAAIAGAVLLVRHLLVFRDDSVPDTTYTRHLGVWPPLLAAVVALACSAPRIRRRWAVASTAIAPSIAVAIVLAVAAAIEYLASRSPYLAYQLGTPTFGASSAGVMLGAFGAFLLAAWWGRRRGESNDSAGSSRAATALVAAAIALGAVFFAATNYAGTRSTMVRALVSLDRRTGVVQWTLAGLEGPQAPIDGRNSPATPTAVTDGQIVCGYFGSAGVLCADADGARRWSRNDLAYDGSYGAGFSLVLVDGTIVVTRDQPTGVAIVDALDARNGSTRWTRTFETTPTFSGNSRTPIVVASGSEKALVFWGMKTVTAMALDDGRSLWSYSYTSSGDLVASAVADADRLYLSDVTGTIALDRAALAAGHDPVRWRSTARSSCVSPVLANGVLFTVTDSGVAAGIRADTGEIIWRRRLPGQYFASLVASPSAVYFTNSEGLTTVVATNGTFETLAQNAIGEETLASMAAAGGELFIRSTRHLYAVGGE